MHTHAGPLLSSVLSSFFICFCITKCVSNLNKGICKFDLDGFEISLYYDSKS